jgi:type IV pilus assembly protein PilZ
MPPRLDTGQEERYGHFMSAEADDANRRSSERFGVMWVVDCETEDTFLYAKITNVSELGIFVRTTSPLPIGTAMRLRFAPASGQAAFDLEGLVQWINPARPTCPNPGMGIRFSAITIDDRERLVDAIRTIAYLPAYQSAS